MKLQIKNFSLKEVLNQCQVPAGFPAVEEKQRRVLVVDKVVKLLNNQKERPSLTNWMIRELKKKDGFTSLTHLFTYLSSDPNSSLPKQSSLEAPCWTRPMSDEVCAEMERIVRNKSLLAFKQKLAADIPALKTVANDPESIREWFENPDHKEVLHQVENLDLSHLRLVHLPEEIKYLEKLQKLNLSTSCLQGVSLQPLAGLHKLRSLDLSMCGLTEVPAQELAQLPALQKLDLSNNYFQKLSSDAFTGLKQIKELSLHNCDLSEIPQSLRDMTAMTDLDLSGNEKITTVADNAFQGLRISMLNLSNTGLFSVPSAALSQIQDTLTDALLAGNNIGSIADDAFSGLQLVSLNLCDNSITEVPGALKQLAATLRYLDLSSNTGHDGPLRIETTSFEGLSLDSLDLSETALTEIPSQALQPLKAMLQMLVLSDNPIGHIDDNVFEGFVLQELYLDGLELTTVPSKALQLLSNTLEELYLNHNDISSLDNEGFAHLQALKGLFLKHLGDNLTIAEKAFKGLSSLERLGLSHNTLEAFPLTAIKDLSALQKIE